MWILQAADLQENGGRRGGSAGSGPLIFRLGPGAIKTVGRAPRADFIVDAALVSRLHCRVTATDTDLEVVDLSSTNGTYVNDKRVHKARIGTGDRLRVGSVELTVDRQSG